jgi:uncharacterized protein YeaO (DUF488 family)
MTVRIVRLGTPRSRGEGTRIGTVRRPPRGVPKSEFASRNWYDVWFPNLAPSVETMKRGQQVTTVAEWQRSRRIPERDGQARKQPRARAARGALASCDFSVGCYCEDEARCHRSVLRALLVERGANVA